MVKITEHQPGHRHLGWRGSPPPAWWASTASASLVLVAIQVAHLHELLLVDVLDIIDLKSKENTCNQ